MMTDEDRPAEPERRVIPELDFKVLDLRDPEVQKAFLKSLKEHGI